MFDNLNKITKAEFHSFTLNVQTTREHESDIGFVQYQSSKRFLVQCKIFVLSSSNFYFLIIVLGFSASPGIPSQLGDMMPLFPCSSTTLIPDQLPSEKSSQAESLEDLQTTPLLMCSAWQSRSLLFVPNESSSEVSGDHVQLSDSGG